MRTEPSPARRRLRTPVVLLGLGVVSSALLAAAGTGTFSVFTAQIGSAASGSSFGTLVMKLESAAGSCISTDGGSGNVASCTAVQEFGGPNDMVPGETKTNTVTVTNTGTLRTASFTLAGGACSVVPSATYPNSASGAADLCSKVQVTVLKADGSTVTGPTSPSSIGSLTLPVLAPGASAVYRFRTQMPDVSNDYQGAGIRVPLTWTFTGETADVAQTKRAGG